MAIYRAKGNDNADATPREILIDAPDAKSARIAAQRANIWSPRVSLIQVGEQFDPNEVIVFDPSPPRDGRVDLMKERPILTIALGVCLGMSMYSLILLVLGALFSN